MFHNDILQNFAGMKKLVVFSGAGMSAESGLQTFRGGDGLWENYRIEDVATPGAWLKNRNKVLDFYNQRRRQIASVQPNAAHSALVLLENYFDLTVITQNIDDLHERAGSKKVLHLHGEITKARSTLNPDLIVDIGYNDILEGQKCERGSQLRPHIVWFGEQVPELERAAGFISEADILLVIGTSLNVYPAAGLIHYAGIECEKYLIDPEAIINKNDFTIIRKAAGEAIPGLVSQLIAAGKS